MKTLQELQPLIIKWAREKDLIKFENAPKQRLKLIEECGELANSILKNNVNEQKDAIGDIFVVYVILANQLEIELFLTNFQLVSINDISLYLMEEIIFTNDIPCVIDYLNDVAVHLGLDITECANIAWEEIKDRTGKNVNGTFIKD